MKKEMYYQYALNNNNKNNMTINNNKINHVKK